MLIISSFYFCLNKFSFSSFRIDSMVSGNFFSALLSVNSSQCFNIDISGLEDLVVFQWVECLREMTVWWSMILLEWSVFNSSSELRFQLIIEITFCEEAILWESMVVWCWLIIPGMRESSSMGVTHIEREIGKSIIDSIKFSSSKEFQKIIFDNWVLSHSSSVGSCGISSNGISESKDVFKSLVLKSILVDINETICISNAWVNKILPRSAWRSNISMSESVF